MGRRHGFDIGTERAPERGEPFYGSHIGAFRRRQDTPAANEQSRKARIGTRMLGSSDRMGRHKMDSLGQMRTHLPHHGSLY